MPRPASLRGLPSAALAVAWLLGAGCEAGAGIDLERMAEQPRHEPYEPSPLFPDGAAMRRPPAGTVPRSAVVGQPLLATGSAGGAYADRVPLPVTRELLARGRARFEVFCAACHGLLGDGESPVAARMAERKPPSLHTPHVRAFPPGRIYRIVREGRGYMPGYAAELSVEERWAVVAYLQALHLSQQAPLDRLPEPIREELVRRAGGREAR